MKTVENGNAVKLHYKGTFLDGEVFDDSRRRVDPLEVLVGSGKFLNAFEEALVGMAEGQIKTVTLTSEQAYGPINPEAVATFGKDNFPEDFEFKIGHPVRGVSPQGQQVIAKIISFTDEDVTLDMNHPLAGKDLNFEIEMVEIEEEVPDTETSDSETSSEE